jgi:hypothetical protein
MKDSVVVNNPDLSASVAKTISNIRVDSNGNRVTFVIQIPSVAWAAALEKMQDTPLENIKDLRAIHPVKEK